MAYVPGRKTEKKDLKPNRYVAIRIKSRQGKLFSDGNSIRYFAVVSNRWEMEGQELLEWHRGKAGTVEQSHDILKNELGCNCLKQWPCRPGMLRQNPNACVSPFSSGSGKWCTTPGRSCYGLPTKHRIL